MSAFWSIPWIPKTSMGLSPHSLGGIRIVVFI